MNAEMVKEISRKALIEKIAQAALSGDTCVWIKASQFHTVKDFLKEGGFKWDSNPNYTMRYQDEEVLYKVSWA